MAALVPRASALTLTFPGSFLAPDGTGTTPCAGLVRNETWDPGTRNASPSPRSRASCLAIVRRPSVVMATVTRAGGQRSGVTGGHEHAVSMGGGPDRRLSIAPWSMGQLGTAWAYLTSRECSKFVFSPRPPSGEHSCRDQGPCCFCDSIEPSR